MKDLIQIINDNPGCVAKIDNDCWTLLKVDPEDCPELEGLSNDECDAWHEKNTLARDGEVIPLGDGGYGSGNIYGGDILQALAAIVGIKVKSV